jgi:hypothetical protein
VAEHAVQIYRDDDELASAVADYLADGFEAGEPGLVVATPDHRRAFAEALHARGWSAAEADGRGLLAAADADETLAAFMGQEGPSSGRFGKTVGSLLDTLAAGPPERRVRIFGEMVELLRRRGQTGAAIQLEELWNDLACTRTFSLLCGYRLDVFDRRAQTSPLPEICRVHSHVRAAADPARLTRAVDRGLGEVLGSDQAGKVYSMVGDEARRGRVPVAQLALMWVSANMPALADRVLAAARAQYERPVAASG